MKINYQLCDTCAKTCKGERLPSSRYACYVKQEERESEVRDKNFETLLTITLKQQKIIDKLEQQNEQMIEALKKVRREICFDCCDLCYIDFECKCDYTKIIDPVIESVTGKKIEESLKQEESDE